MDPLDTIGQVVQYIEEHHSNPKAFNYLKDGNWSHLSTEAFLFDLKRLTYGLIDLGLRRGDKVGILALSSPYWNLADFAIILAGGITVPLFGRISDENLIYEVAQANIRFLFVQGESEWALYERHHNLFERVIGLDDGGGTEGTMTFHDLLVRGEHLWGKQPRLWEEQLAQLHTDDVCTIIYTSGSMGVPKGVEITHKNLVHLIGRERFGWKKDHDVYLSILPLAHIFARQINLILICRGVSIYYLNDLSLLASTCQKIKPTLMILVPRLLEKLHAVFEAQGEGEKNRWKRGFFKWAFRLANANKHSTLKKWLLYPIADFFIYSKFRQALGGKWNVILCGGAALDTKIYRFFLRIGFPIYEGWGLTEGSFVCVNTPKYLKVGTVGKPLPGMKIKIGQEKEVLVSGPTLMKGYYRNPHATQAAIDEEGWLHTGDKGVIDNEEYLTLIGRVKEHFKLSSGEYVSPDPIEHMLCQHPFIDRALVVGEGKKYPICLLFPDRSQVERRQFKQNMDHLSFADYLQTKEIQQEIEIFLEKINERINAWEHLIHYRFVYDIPTVEEGALTPTLKLKREFILQKYADLIKTIYKAEGE